METWKKILIGIAAFLAVVCIGGFCLIKFYLIPTYVEPALQLAADALKDSEVQESLAKLADELVEEGVLSRSTAKDYIRKINNQNHSQGETEAEENELDSILTDEDIQKHFDEEDEEDKRDNESMIVAYSSNSNIGIETIKSDEDHTDSEPTSYHTYSDKQDYIETNQSEDEIPKTAESDSNSKSKAQSLYDKIINAMNASERSTFFTVMTKVSVSELRSLYNDGDREGIKSYLKEKLSTETYKKAVSIFYKYAHLLYEE